MHGLQLISNIENGTITDGTELWVCALYYRDVLLSRPTRHVKPTLVRVESWKAKTPIHHQGYRATVKHKKLTPVFPPRKALAIIGGVSDREALLSGFETEAECVAVYQEMVEKVRAQINAARESTRVALEKASEEIEKYQAEITR